MSTYIYEDGAIHHDHHKEMTITLIFICFMLPLWSKKKQYANEELKEISWKRHWKLFVRLLIKNNRISWMSCVAFFFRKFGKITLKSIV